MAYLIIMTLDLVHAKFIRKNAMSKRTIFRSDNFVVCVNRSSYAYKKDINFEVDGSESSSFISVINSLHKSL